MRISTTALESYRLFCLPDQEWMTEADLQQSILGDVPKDRPMLIGLAFEDIVRHPGLFAVSGGYIARGYQFSGAEMDPIIRSFDRRGLWQVKTTKMYGPHTVVSKADYLLGAALTEIKTKDGQFDIDRYLHSYQWRFMADAFGPGRIEYRVFRVNDHGNSVIEIKDEDRFPVYPYPELHADCARLVDDFAAFVTVKGWAPELERRQVAWA